MDISSACDRCGVPIDLDTALLVTQQYSYDTEHEEYDFLCEQCEEAFKTFMKGAQDENNK